MCASDRPTVLIADDDMDIRMLVRSLLETTGCGVDVVGEAADGLEALDVYGAVRTPEVPDVIILDNRMPGCSGMDVADRILADEPDQRIVLFSAFLTPDLEREARDIGIAACVGKNDFASLPEVVKQLASA